MFEKVKDIVLHYEELIEKLSGTDFSKAPEAYKKIMKEQSDIKPIVDLYALYEKHTETLCHDKDLLETESDEDLRSLAKEEIKEMEALLSAEEKELTALLLPKDPLDDKNVIMEIRSGVGGSESQIWAGDLYRMYSRYSARCGWKVELLEYNGSELGGANKITVMISGKGAYSALKFESGVHRVQRIPKTEAQGRIQTSSATVVVMPEADEVDVEIKPEDCRIDVCRASGNGGQCVNTTDSAVRLVHLPTGIMIYCQEEKSQLKNRDKAFRVLRSKLYELELEKRQDASDAIRRANIGTGDRSEKIRTYNFPQGRITDHRINQSFFNMEAMMDGELQPLMDALNHSDQANKLSKSENGS